ncbi:Ig-like domain-containing protein [Ignavibacterium sp.]|uniref:Ig-like domain-containing protein n=1 Tax=Ignavibacterium sp. TaxID=2651167 RepID=UPI00307E5C80
MKIFHLLSLSLLLIFTFNSLNAQQVTGLSNWNIYLDPGHSQFENMGIYGYSEAEKNLRVGLHLRQMLLDWTDIDTVYICRDDDTDFVTLPQRTDQANALGAAHYHSIHSDASSSPTPNSTLLLWGQLGINGPEKFPPGGKKMSDIMVVLLTAGMRTTTRGSVGDRTFYGVPGNVPYLHVNRATNMASELSEAGFHTNPTQNQRNMNELWKRMEAKTKFWTILKYHDLPRPYAGTVAGIITDYESGLPINGAITEINGQIDTTDTYESLFYRFGYAPDFLRNGFYYFENIPQGTHPIKFYRNGYDTLNTTVTMQDTFITFKDVQMISNTPPAVESTNPANNDSLYPGYENLVINFTRQMDRSSTENAISISPSVGVTFSWSNNDKTLTINTSNFAFSSSYQITINPSAQGKFGHPFDGNGDGTPGDSFVMTVYTKQQDNAAPQIVSIYPNPNANNVEIKPVINILFNEPLSASSVSGKIKVLRNSNGTFATGILRFYTVNGRSALNFFVTTLLAENENYTVQILPGIKDIYGNEITVQTDFSFTTGNNTYNQLLLIDNFENGVGSWWQPTQSGSTVGVNPTNTTMSLSSSVVNLNTGSTKSMQLNYEWDTSASNWLIREKYTPVTPTFDNSNILQTFIWGDGSNNQFRFCVIDQGVGGYEVSPWYTIDWIGWKAVNWNLAEGQTGTWLGNGILEPPLRIDSYQLTYSQGNPNTGTLYFDDLRIVNFAPLSVEPIDGSVPASYSLSQNYPNPFNPSTRINFSLPNQASVKIIISDILGREVSTLINDNLSAGNYSLEFNASEIPSGIYFYTMITDNFKQSRKMLILK